MTPKEDAKLGGVGPIVLLYGGLKVNVFSVFIQWQVRGLLWSEASTPLVAWKALELQVNVSCGRPWKDLEGPVATGPTGP